MVDLLLISEVRISPKRSNPAAEWVDTIWKLHTLLDVRRSPTVLHVYANLIRFRYVIKDSIQQERERESHKWRQFKGVIKFKQPREFCLLCEIMLGACESVD